MQFSEYLQAEWKPAMGCTEPAAVAYAAALAAAQGSGLVRMVHLVCDPRTYKNCYAVGLPNSEGKTGILWALAIGAHLTDVSLGLRSFEGVSGEILLPAQDLLERHGIHVEVDADRSQLLIDVTVVREGGTGRAVLEKEHTHLARLEANGKVLDTGKSTGAGPISSVREILAGWKIGQLMDLARSLSGEDRRLLRSGAEKNIAIARRGLSFLPPLDFGMGAESPWARISRLAGAGVYARMSGEPMVVMSLAGSGNKGITVSVPIRLWGQERGLEEDRIDEAMALACLITSVTTFHLGTLSAVCGCTNASGIGIASALVMMEGGGVDQICLAIRNMVGNVAGMICDGAKIGCTLKTMTGIDAAFRAAGLALAGIGIPATDGIVGEDGESSLFHLGRLAQHGMSGTDTEILNIMQHKLKHFR